MDSDFNWLNILENPEIMSEEVIKSALTYARENLEELLNQDCHLQWSLEMFKKVLDSDEIDDLNEEFIFINVKKRFELKNENKENDLHNILEVVKLPLVSLKFLMSDVEPYIGLIPKCRPYFLEALRYHIFPDERSNISPKRTTPRQIILSTRVLVVNMQKDIGTLELYDSTDHNVKKLNQVNVPEKINFGAVVSRNSLLMIGGFIKNRLKVLKQVDSINLTTGEVSSFEPMQEARQCHGVAAVGNDLSSVVYAIGGKDGRNFLDSVERWEAMTLSWSYVASMSVGRANCGVAVLGEKIYVGGGRKGEMNEDGLDLFEVYDPAIDEWMIKPPMPSKRSYCTLVTVGRCIYAVSGYFDNMHFGTKRVDRFDPASNVWNSYTEVSIPGIIGSCSIDNKLVCAGGDEKRFEHLKEYIEEEKKWNIFAKFNMQHEQIMLIRLPNYMNYYDFNW